MAEASYKVKGEMIFQSCNKGTMCTCDVYYICDPERNTECKKTNCGECKMTKDIRFAKRFDLFDELS